ncbi:helix-turn-helix domain-containing protein [Acholeplasma hippikon]|uniref:Transcriptional repressor DicA n=1 Tax=Acholeplasma hippikon TaxID=264636 RepID=A0A449BLC2_9MOLU|nr:helix-turn-helix transcriptional regulator [Acholeplasma hippikon]VEU83237.1 transcriptional repressor DicA [Acholeplasma hippikon]
MNIAEQIILKRKEINMTQKELAEKLGVSDKTVSRYEQGTSIPDVQMLKKIGDILSIDFKAYFEQDLKQQTPKKLNDYEEMKKFRKGYFMSFFLFLFSAFLIFLIKSSNGQTDSISYILNPFFLIMALIMVMYAIMVYSLRMIGYLFFLKDKKDKKIYYKEIFSSIFMLSLALLFLVFSFIA